MEGVLQTLDDFNVALRDAQGNYRSFKITPELKVVKHDPYAMHVTLLDQYTDKDMHDIVAYLESPEMITVRLSGRYWLLRYCWSPLSRASP